MTTYPKETFLNKIINAWPIIATVASCFLAIYIKIELQEVRVTSLENNFKLMREDYKEELSSIRKDWKESLDKTTTAINLLQLDVRQLVTLQIEDSKRRN